MPRSVTAPIAMGISDLIGGIPSMTAIITILTGILGAAFGSFTLDLIKIQNKSARQLNVERTLAGVLGMFREVIGVVFGVCFGSVW